VLEDAVKTRRVHRTLVSLSHNMVLPDDVIFRLLAIQHQLHIMGDLPTQRYLPNRPALLGHTIWLMTGVYHTLTAAKTSPITRYQEEVLTNMFRRTVLRIFDEYLKHNQGQELTSAEGNEGYTNVNATRGRLFIREQRLSAARQLDPFKRSPPPARGLHPRYKKHSPDAHSRHARPSSPMKKVEKQHKPADRSNSKRAEVRFTPSPEPVDKEETDWADCQSDNHESETENDNYQVNTGSSAIETTPEGDDTAV